MKFCDFSENLSPVLIVTSPNDDQYSTCNLNVIIIGPSLIAGNKAFNMHHIPKLIYIIEARIKVIGPVIMTHNTASTMITCIDCDIMFSEHIEFTSNECTNSIISVDSENAYVKVMEYSNVSFINNFSSGKAIALQPSNQKNYPSFFCGFQYVTENNNIVSNLTVLEKHYIVIFYNNNALPIVDQNPCESSFNHFITHCRWMPESVFYGEDPGVINLKIIQTDQHQLSHHSTICYCSHNEPNCSVDVLGPIYPGEKLQVDLCVPSIGDKNDDRNNKNVNNNILYVETRLPTSACEIVFQTELFQAFTSYSTTFNFTIVTKFIERCELFITLLPCMHTSYEVFYVEILPCPAGFTLQNGVCNCDLYLVNSSIHIDTCYIDQSLIKRPANTWITALNHTNITQYIISQKCPLDYCLPHSSHLNLLHPDLQCQFNRTGILCSQCQHSLSMVFGSSRCIHCTNIHILISTLVIVAGIVLVVLLYIFNLTVTNGTINGIIFYANIISINDSTFLANNNLFKPLQQFISFANLDLGIETCFYDGMDGYAKIFLQLFFPFYLILIAVSIIVASRYSSRLLRWTYTRSLPVLATLFLLSYTSVLRAVLTVLFSYSTITELPSGHQQLVWSIDASVPLFGLKFTMLFIICLVLFLLLIPFNIVLLFTRCFS